MLVEDQLVHEHQVQQMEQMERVQQVHQMHQMHPVHPVHHSSHTPDGQQPQTLLAVQVELLGVRPKPSWSHPQSHCACALEATVMGEDSMRSVGVVVVVDDEGQHEHHQQTHHLMTQGDPHLLPLLTMLPVEVVHGSLMHVERRYVELMHVGRLHVFVGLYVSL